MDDLISIRSNKILERTLFIRIGDLINIDGPLLTLFQDQKDTSFYLYDWMDTNNRVNRWIIYKVSPSDILKYIGGEITHLKLFSKAEKLIYYYTDIDPCNLSEYQIFELKFLPERYCKTSDNLFDEEYCPDVQKILLFVNRAQATEEKASFYDLNMDISMSAVTNLADAYGFFDELSQPNFAQIKIDRSITAELEFSIIGGEVFKNVIKVRDNIRKDNLNKKQVNDLSRINAYNNSDSVHQSLKQAQ